MLRLEDVHSYYGPSHVVQGVSLSVARGETVALVGRNGAGKTTLLKTIMGIVPARRGHVHLEIAGAQRGGGFETDEACPQHHRPPRALGDRGDPAAVGRVQVEDPVGLAIADRAQHDRLGFQGCGQAILFEV